MLFVKKNLRPSKNIACFVGKPVSQLFSFSFFERKQRKKYTI